MLIGIMLSDIMFIGIMLSVTMLSDFMLSGIKMSVIILVSLSPMPWSLSRDHFYNKLSNFQFIKLISGSV